MSIELNGHLFRTLNNEMFVNGQKVTEAYCNGIKVYPEDNVLYLRLKGQFAATYTRTFTYKLETWDPDVITCTISASYDMGVKVNPAGTGVPKWERVFNKEAKDVFDPHYVVMVEGAQSCQMLSASVNINASQIRSDGEIRGLTMYGGVIGVITTLKPLGVITMFNGIHRIGQGSKFRGDLRSVGRKVPRRLISGFYESDENLVSVSLSSSDSKDGVITISGLALNLAEVCDMMEVEIAPYGAPYTSYGFKNIAFTHKVGVDSAVEISPAQAVSML